MTALDSSKATIAQWFQEFRDRATDTEIHAEVFLRACAPPLGCHDHQTECMQRLANAKEEGVLDSYDISVVGDEICRDEQYRQFYSGKPVETVLEIKSWRSGGIRATGFTEREVHSTITDETTDTVVPPTLTVAVYADESLIGVFPCQADDESYGPEFFIERCLSTQEGTDPQLIGGSPQS